MRVYSIFKQKSMLFVSRSYGLNSYKRLLENLIITQHN